MEHWKAKYDRATDEARKVIESLEADKIMAVAEAKQKVKWTFLL